MTGSDNAAIVTVQDVRKWLSERDEAEAYVKHWQEKLQELTARISLIAGILGPERMAELTKTPSEDREEQLPAADTFAGWIHKTVWEHEGWITLRAIAKKTVGSDFEQQHKRNPNGIYNAVKRLTDRGALVRNGNHVIDANRYQELKELGIEPDSLILSETETPASTREEILQLLAGKPEGMKAAEIIQALKKVPTVAERMRLNPQHPYSILSRMVQREQVTKNEDTYFSTQSLPF